MLHFISKALLPSRNGYTTFTAQNPSMAVSLSLRYLSSDSNGYSFTVSYLVNSCGLSSESALTASKAVQFETQDKPDLILSFFEKLGFSKSQISKMITRFPQMLTYDPKKIIFPKVELFLSKGASTSDLVRIFTDCPWILRTSLENQLVPTFNLLIELFQTEDKAIEVIKQAPRLLCTRPEGYLIPNMNTLRENGMPVANILFMVHYHWRSILTNSVKFGEIVEEAKQLGFSPLNTQFVAAIAVLSISKSKRDRKVDAYKRWGWSNKDIITAFRRYPWCMALSEDKLMAVMDFFVIQLGLDASVIVSYPLLLGLSLKKRLIPRGEVVQFLLFKGLVKLDSSITSAFRCTEKCFLEKYVNCHEEFAPHLIKLYVASMNSNASQVTADANSTASPTARSSRSKKGDSTV